LGIILHREAVLQLAKAEHHDIATAHKANSDFLTIVEKAKAACRTMRLDPQNHFVDVTDMVEIGSGGDG
jgi:hypothetical protein